MKLVKEILNEKFTDEESDPVRDMGIGLKSELNKFKEDLYNRRYATEMKDFMNNDDDLLWIAARHGKIKLVKYLLNNGANIHRLSDRALRWASHNGHHDIVKYLLENGADVHAYEESAIYLATDKKIIKLLQRYGAKYIKSRQIPTNESLNEKFTDESDPVRDMGIGLKITRIKYGDIIVLKKPLSVKNGKCIFSHRSDIVNSYAIGNAAVIININKLKNNLELELIFLPSVESAKITSQLVTNEDEPDRHYITRTINTTYKNWHKYFDVILKDEIS